MGTKNRTFSKDEYFQMKMEHSSKENIPKGTEPSINLSRLDWSGAELGGDEPPLEKIQVLLARIVQETTSRSGLVLTCDPVTSRTTVLAAINLPSNLSDDLFNPDSNLSQNVIQLSQCDGVQQIYDSAHGALLGISIDQKDSLCGMLLLQGEIGRQPDPSRLQQWLLPLSVAIDEHLLLQSGDSRSSKLEGFQKILVNLTSTLELEEILSWTVAGIRATVNVEAGSLLLLDEERAKLVFRRTLDGEPDWMFHIALQVGQGVAGECFQSGVPILVNAVDEDPRFCSQVDSVTGFKTQSLLCVPLSTGRRTIGVLEVINKRNGSFNDEDVELISTLGAIVANAIENARLFQLLTIANADLEASRWEIARSKGTLQALFDGLQAPIYIIDQNYDLVAVNKSVIQQCGKPFPELIGFACYEALYQRSRPCRGCLVHQTFEEGISTQRSDRRWGNQTAPQSWEIFTYPIVDPVGQTSQVIIFTREVTERKRLEDSLARSERLAVVGQLASAVAHEINNPLTAILANSQMLLNELDPKGEQREAADLIQQAGARALAVVQRLIKLSEHENGEFVPLDINKTLLNAVEWSHQHFEEAGSLITLDLAPQLPVTFANPESLEGLWLNLLIYVLTESEPGGGEVSVSSRMSKDHIEVVVAMCASPEPDRLEMQSSIPRSLVEENGMGLSFCHRIIRQHGGQIFVETQPDAAIRFSVTLPLQGSALV
jgi:two-component system, NtrC family, sensor kinase